MGAGPDARTGPIYRCRVGVEETPPSKRSVGKMRGVLPWILGAHLWYPGGPWLSDPFFQARCERLTIAVVYEDNHVLVVDKPAGLATMGTEESAPSLARDIKHYLKEKYKKPGNVYLGIVSRLDAVTSGLIVFAKTSKAAGRLTTQFQERRVSKRYLAVVPSVRPQPANSHGSGPWARTVHDRWEDWVWKDDKAHRMRGKIGVSESSTNASTLGCVPESEANRGPSQVPEPLGKPPSPIRGPGDQDATGVQLAALNWRLLASGAGHSLVLVHLETGRKHQIRVQFALRGLAIVGDRKYGSSETFSSGIALHSWALRFQHPVTRELLAFVAPPPATWRSLGQFRVEPDLPSGEGDGRPPATAPARSWDIGVLARQLAGTVHQE
jgi:23S rRNA pseudouridine1911/1915/1917 synthase